MFNPASSFIFNPIHLYLSRKFGLKVKPRFINFIITYKCNSRCTMCNIWKRYLEKPESNELNLQEIEAFLINNKNFLSHLRHVGFTGGEPLLREDIVEIIRLFRHHVPKAALGMQTNGLIPGLVKKRVSEIIKFYPDFSVAVSIDGIGDLHSKVRGINGAFENAVESINIAKGLGIERITCGMTITKDNFNFIKETKEFVDGLGCEFSCFLPDKSTYFNNQDVDIELTPAQKQVVIQSLKTLAGYHYYMDNLWMQMLGIRRREARCHSGYISLVIDPYGNIKPCILIDEAFGNIKGVKLDEMLFNINGRRLKNSLLSCSCWSQCEVSTSVIADSRDVLKWVLFYCRNKKGFIDNLKKRFF